MIIIDSSVLIALAVKTDTQHERAIAALDKVTDTACVPNGVLVETAQVLWRLGQNPEFMARWCRQLSEKFELQPEPLEIIKNSMERYAQEARRFSLVDCQLIEWHKTLGFDVLSFDDAVNRELQRS